MGCCGSFGCNNQIEPHKICGVTTDAFPAKAGPTGVRGVFVGLALAGKARFDAINFAVWHLTLSRLKPVLQGYAVFS